MLLHFWQFIRWDTRRSSNSLHFTSPSQNGMLTAPLKIPLTAQSIMKVAGGFDGPPRMRLASYGIPKAFLWPLTRAVLDVLDPVSNKSVGGQKPSIGRVE